MTVKQALSMERYLCVDEINRRIKLTSGGPHVAAVAEVAVQRAATLGFDKIWGFVSFAEWVELSQLHFVREGTLDGYFPDGPGIGVARYLSVERAHSRCDNLANAIVKAAQAQAATAPTALPAGYALRPGRRQDCQAISDILTEVFTTYPTPIDSAEAIADAMDRDVAFMLAEHEGAIVSVMSADIDRAHLVAEMTDCATLPGYRGRGLMQALLSRMEAEMCRAGLRSLFTLARATSPGMNIAFARLGYRYRGCFVNNCHIAGDWEDMNLWVKLLGSEWHDTRQ
ncbi:MAG: putative beta-lysine N-acetyltransferase [Armatimonadota bacterium]